MESNLTHYNLLGLKIDKSILAHFPIKTERKEGQLYLFGYPVIHEESEYESSFICIVFNKESWEENVSSTIPLSLPDNLSNLTDKFRKDMEALNLWNKENFGFWSITYYDEE